MAPKSEYRALSEKLFKELKSGINSGQKIYENTETFGFTKIESYSDWSGMTVNRNRNGLLTFISFSLFREEQ